MVDRNLPQRWNQDPVPGRPAPDDAAEQNEESVLRFLLDFLGLARRNFLLVFSTTALALAGAFILIRMEKPVYRATATVRFDKSRGLSGLGGDARPTAGGLVTDPLLTQIQVLQSRGVAAEVVKRAGLRVRYEPAQIDSILADVRLDSAMQGGEIVLALTPSRFSVARGESKISGTYGVPMTIGGLTFTVPRYPGVEKVTIFVSSPDGAIDYVLGSLKGRPRERTDIIDLTFDAESPTFARRVVNIAAEVFRDMNIESAKQEAVRRREFIETQLQKAEVMLSEAQAAHNRFRSREKVFSSMEKFRAQQADLSLIELRRQELSADRGMFVALLQALEDSSRQGSTEERLNALVSSPGIGANSVVTGLYQQLTKLQGTRDSLTTGPFRAAPGSPEVVRLNALIASTESNIASAVRGQISATDARLQALDELRQRSSSSMATLPTTEAEESGLLAHVETYRRESDRLREELQKAQIEVAAQVGQISIVDLAPLPGWPIGGGKMPRLLLALILGLSVGTLGAYIFENYSAVVRRREDVERISGVPILAIVPPFTNGTSNGKKLLAWAQHSGNGKSSALALEQPNELVTMTDVRSHAAEAYRTLRTNLLFSTELASLRHIIVTSGGPGEGKTSTAANLAVAFAQQGKRVLLVDCDLRRPRIHKVFRKPQIPGLTNTLVMGTSYVDAVLPTDTENLYVLPAGSTPPNPVELLGSTRMTELIQRLSENYDLLVFDTPPVLVASDATILSRYSDATLFVVRAGKTQTAALRDALDRLRTVGCNLIGTSINDPSGDIAKFSGYYGYYYQEYYGADANT